MGPRLAVAGLSLLLLSDVATGQTVCTNHTTTGQSTIGIGNFNGFAEQPLDCNNPLAVFFYSWQGSAWGEADCIDHFDQAYRAWVFRLPDIHMATAGGDKALCWAGLPWGLFSGPSVVELPCGGDSLCKTVRAREWSGQLVWEVFPTAGRYVDLEPQWQCTPRELTAQWEECRCTWQICYYQDCHNETECHDDPCYCSGTTNICPTVCTGTTVCNDMPYACCLW